jgi:serine/threonine protein kinase
LITSFCDEDYLYIETEFTDGGDLRNLIRTIGDYLPRKLVLELGGQLIDTLEYINSRIIFHLEIRPENILLMGDTTVKLCDFGISKLFDSSFLSVGAMLMMISSHSSQLDKKFSIFLNQPLETDGNQIGLN